MLPHITESRENGDFTKGSKVFSGYDDQYGIGQWLSTAKEHRSGNERPSLVPLRIYHDILEALQKIVAACL